MKSKAEKTKEFIIERSAPIFNRKGYGATSLSDIMEATGLTKGSIYGNFENKDEVAVQVYKYNITSLKRRLYEAMDAKAMAEEKLFAFADFYRSNWQNIFEHGGCPILNAATEADDHSAFLKKHVQVSITGWGNQIGAVIEAGQQNGEFSSGIDPVKSAFDILTILEGGIMLSKIMEDPKYLFSALDRIKVLIRTELK